MDTLYQLVEIQALSMKYIEMLLFCVIDMCYSMCVYVYVYMYFVTTNVLTNKQEEVPRHFFFC